MTKTSDMIFNSEWIVYHNFFIKDGKIEKKRKQQTD